MPNLPRIPQYITVHLGEPSSDTQNVTVTFPEYIKNVASCEIYPTWPEASLTANIYAQISVALNRVYTEYYRSRGYNFDITSSTQFDQAFQYGRSIFENVAQIVDRIFNSYIRRQGFIEPLYATFCDGIEVNCEGLSQWGTVELAENGYSFFEILTYYYGEDINIVSNVEVENIRESAPRVPLRLGSSGPNVQLLQNRINRISSNYSGIPKIFPADGIFGPETEESVKVFQEVFNLTPDGIVGNATWYRIQYIYIAVKSLNTLNSEGLKLSEVSTQFPSVLSNGASGTGVLVLQYYLSYISQFITSIPKISIDGAFGNSTENAVKAFQSTYGLPPDGIVGEITWDKIYNVYLGIIESITIEYSQGVTIPFPGVILRLGSEGNDVRVLQEYLDYIEPSFPELLPVTPDGIFGVETQNAVIAFQELFDLPGTRGTVTSFIWDAITDVYDDVYFGNTATEGQFPGYTAGESEATA